jgi:HTH-type transcriptional regulator/antitoxin HipB
MKKNNDIKSFDEHLDEQYGKKGSESRNEFESGYEAFKLGVALQQLRNEVGLTQEELANKCGTTKSYISRIENNASDIRLSTIIRIFKQGFDKDLRLTLS